MSCLHGLFRKSASGSGPSQTAIKCFLICSAEPRGLCRDPRILVHLTKVPQVFRNPGSPALQNEEPIRCAAIFSQTSGQFGTDAATGSCLSSDWEFPLGTPEDENDDVCYIPARSCQAIAARRAFGRGSDGVRAGT